MVEVSLILENSVGLHARPAAEMIKLASKFKSTVTLTGAGKTVNAKSILAVLTMGLFKGDIIMIAADGPDEEECIEALKQLVLNRFGEE